MPSKICLSYILYDEKHYLHGMSALITVFKSHLVEHPDVLPKLHPIASEVKELEDAFVFSIKAGMLMRFLRILNDENIAYGTHFRDDQNLKENTFDQRSI